jgi:peptide/nickel transport system permease protein
MDRGILRTFRRNKTAVVGAVVAVVVVLVALLAPAISPYDPLKQNVYYRLTPPEGAHPFGTDSFGRDVFSRVIYGARVSLLVGISSVLIGIVAGTILGMLAGFLGGRVETVIMRTVDVLMCFPDLILGLMVMAVLGPGLLKLILTIGIVMTPRFARMAYGSTLTIKQKDYVEAARAVGTPMGRILFTHVLPNIFGELLVMATLWTGAAIRIEANLSFIGLGVPPPTPTWGNMIRAGVDYLTNAPWLSVFPGLAILITILAFNMLGDGIRDVTDPRLRGG